MELTVKITRRVVALGPPSQPVASGAEEAADFLTAGQFARRLRISREPVRRLAIAKVLPNTVVCRGARKATRRFPRRFADEFAASGLDVSELAEFAARWRARVFGSRGMTASRTRPTNSGGQPCLPWCVTDGGDPASAGCAKAICRSCPAHPACLEWPLAANERTRIWGGTRATSGARCGGRPPRP